MEASNELLEKAIAFAVEKHAGQKRKGDKSPYILHPFRVLAILQTVKRTKNLNLLLIICVLHDVVEDCGVTLEEIARLFGYHVAAIVEELTTDKVMCDKMGKKDYLLQKMLKMTSYALCVKLCDRLDNVRDILDGLAARKLSKTHKILSSMIRRELKKCYN